MSELRNTWVNSLPEQVVENTQDIAELQQDATDEAINRENADNALQSQITQEVSAREAADENLQEQITNNTLPGTLRGVTDKIQTTQDHTYIFAKNNAEPGSPMNASGVLLSNDSADTDSNYAGLQAVKPQTSGGANYTQLLLQYDSDGTAHANINVFENGSQSKTVDLLASSGGGGIQSQTTTIGNAYNEILQLVNSGHKIQYIDLEMPMSSRIFGTVYTIALSENGVDINTLGNESMISGYGQNIRFNAASTMQNEFSFSSKYSTTDVALTFTVNGVSFYYNQYVMANNGSSLTFRVGTLSRTTLFNGFNVTIYYI